MPLTPRQEKFALAYVETGNASAAYRRCYSSANMLTETINRRAHAVLHNGKVEARVKELQARHVAKHDITVARVLDEYRKLAFLDIRKVFDSAGSLLPIQDIDDETAAAIAGLEFEEVFDRTGDQKVHVGRIHKLKLADKIRALDAIGRHLGMFVDQSKIDVTIADSEDPKSRLAAALARRTAAGGATQPNPGDAE